MTDTDEKAVREPKDNDTRLADLADQFHVAELASCDADTAEWAAKGRDDLEVAAKFDVMNDNLIDYAYRRLMPNFCNVPAATVAGLRTKLRMLIEWEHDGDDDWREGLDDPDNQNTADKVLLSIERDLERMTAGS